MEYDCIMSTGNLEHSGIKGMKWGIRRFQNKDGSLTPAGRKRYADELAAREKSIKSRERAKAQQDKLNAKKAELDARERALEPPKKGLFGKKKQTPQPEVEKRKSVKDMTDKELDEAIARARKEDEYNRLRPAPQPKRDFKDMLIQDVVTPALTEYGKKALGEMMTGIVKKAMGDKVDPNSMEALKKTYDRLRLETDIDKLQHPEKYKSADERTKEYDLEVKKAKDKAARKKQEADEEAARKKQEAEENARKQKEADDKRWKEQVAESEARARRERDADEARQAARIKKEAKEEAKRAKKEAKEEARQAKQAAKESRKNDTPEIIDTDEAKSRREARYEEVRRRWNDPWGDAPEVDAVYRSAENTGLSTFVSRQATNYGRDYVNNIFLLEEGRGGR